MISNYESNNKMKDTLTNSHKKLQNNNAVPYN